MREEMIVPPEKLVVEEEQIMVSLSLIFLVAAVGRISKITCVNVVMLYLLMLTSMGRVWWSFPIVMIWSMRFAL
jgi:hypothetical protein